MGMLSYQKRLIYPHVYVHYTVSSEHCPLHTALNTATAHFILYTAHCKMHTSHCTLRIEPSVPNLFTGREHKLLFDLLANLYRPLRNTNKYKDVQII